MSALSPFLGCLLKTEAQHSTARVFFPEEAQHGETAFNVEECGMQDRQFRKRINVPCSGCVVSAYPRPAASRVLELA